MSAFQSNQLTGMAKTRALHPALNRQLVFGDREQIAAIRRIESDADRHEPGKMRLFDVEIHVDLCRYVRVAARCAAEAEEMTRRNLMDWLSANDVNISASEVED